MNKKIFVGILLIMLIFLTSCSASITGDYARECFEGKQITLDEESAIACKSKCILHYDENAVFEYNAKTNECVCIEKICIK